MSSPEITNDIDELLFLLRDHPCYSRHHAALTALVAERDSLRAEIAAAYRDRASSKSVLASVIGEREKAKADFADAWRERSEFAKRIDEADAANAALIKERNSLVWERSALRQRIAELESQPPASDLRERLVESALRGAGTGAARSVRSSMLTEAEAEALGRQAVWMADGAFDEMRKGATDAE